MLLSRRSLLCQRWNRSDARAVLRAGDCLGPSRCVLSQLVSVLQAAGDSIWESDLA